MPAHLHYTQALSFPFYAFLEMLSSGRHPFLHSRRRKQLSRFHVMLNLSENPRRSYARPTNHDAINPIAVSIFDRFFWRVDVTVTEDRDVDPGVILYSCNQ